MQNRFRRNAEKTQSRSESYFNLNIRTWKHYKDNGQKISNKPFIRNTEPQLAHLMLGCKSLDTLELRV